MTLAGRTKPTLARRHLQAEIMDQPDLDVGRHDQALAGLARINWLSRSADILWPPIGQLAAEVGGRPLTLLDVATGAGDLPVALWRKARRAGLNLEVSACDISQRAVDHARRRAKQAGAPVRYFQRDVLADDLSDDATHRWDVVISSLFLHHLEEPQAVELLRRMNAAAEHLVLINDLRRCRAGYWLAYVGARLLSRSDVVHVDGPRSVEGAFTLDEARGLCRQAGLEPIDSHRRWPCRYLLTWRRAANPPADNSPAVGCSALAASQPAVLPP
jgi:2-polyprenyl-3-methyl-5-hydroxy-6-metoxy-1,4-benzoquinol methylase